MYKKSNGLLDMLSKTMHNAVLDIIDGKYTQSNYKITIIIENNIDDKTGILVGQKIITKNMSKYKADTILNTIENIILRI